ncbi:MAG: peroxidase family protein, partial [Hyphomicrobiaceae bacterium]
ELNSVEDIDVNGGGGNDTFVISGDFDGTDLAPNTITITGSNDDDTVDITGLTSDHRVVLNGEGGTDTFIGMRDQDVANGPPGSEIRENDDGTTSIIGGNTGIGSTSYGFTGNDLDDLLTIVQDPDEIRDLEGTDNNLTPGNENFGSADQPFIRLTDAHYGGPDGNGNFDIDPLRADLDPRDISNILGDHESGLATNAAGLNIFFNAFGQYFDHGLDFLPKGGNGSIPIGGVDMGPPNPSNPVDLTRGTVVGYDEDGFPLHNNQTSPFVDQNQAYGSTELVGTFLREGRMDGSGGLTARVFMGDPDPSSPSFDLLPTLGQIVRHHWANNTIFQDPTYLPDPMTFQEMYPGLMDNGVIDTGILSDLAGNFMGTGHPILIDINGHIDLEDHFVVGDGRANENTTLTSMHTIWARNHNHHVDQLQVADFAGTPNETFQAAKVVNITEYQRVVYTEFADALLGGMKGSGSHGHDEYNPDVDAQISYEFSGAAYRFGHSMLGQTITVLDDYGQPTEVSLFDAFLNPGDVATSGVGRIIGGIVTQEAEETDVNVVDAVRNDLVRIPADLFAFNVARGRDLGLGTLNQVRSDLANSTDPYVMEAVERGTDDFTPYTSWADFQQRNDLSDAVIDQFKQAYPDAVIDGQLIKGIDRVDLWVGGLAEAHVNGGVVGETFWVIIHEQLDRLQEGDRLYYFDQTDDLDFYDFVEDQSFAAIVARNTGLTDLPESIFYTTNTAPVLPDDAVVLKEIGVLESGTVTVDATSGDDWHTVMFSEAIAGAVVTMMINTSAGTQPVTARVRNVTDDGFEFKLDEYEYLNGTHMLETLSWVAVAEGEHVLSDGSVIKAGTTMEDGSGSSAVAFGGGTAFSGAPVV